MLEKNITNEQYNLSKILLLHYLSIYTLIGVRGQIKHIFRLLRWSPKYYVYV